MQQRATMTKAQAWFKAERDQARRERFRLIKKGFIRPVQWGFAPEILVKKPDGTWHLPAKFVS